ncbi:lanthionine synthetase C family protein [Streptomyces sp. NPDC048644]|uniref:lanthionine synthetase C family protein n=1 Tax=Streptomyces sp. NPDC048644 TaxID=3365582 RepID=UPI003710FEEA
MTPTGRLRARAADAAAGIAARLADPEHVAAAAPDWSPLSLDGGHPGLALLFAELARHDPSLRAVAHAHLAAAATHLPARAGHSLYHGGPALAFAAHTARQAPQHYAGLLERLDPLLDAALHRALEDEHTRLAQGRPGVPCARYDLVSGVTGLTRLLLARQDTHREALADALSYLVRLTCPLSLDGEPVPGWWAPAGPGGGPDPDFPRGHVNYGLAHGISGPLAVLSAALLAGTSVPGVRRAVADLAGELLARRTTEGGWPALIPLERYGKEPPPPGRSAWCYGTPGVACALHRAGQALGRPDLQRIAVDALAADLDHPRRVTDPTFCHGRAGLLHICHTLATASGDPRLAAHRDTLAAQLLTAHRPPGPHDHPGLLTGTAGIALALHAYATGTPPASGWDGALLLS